MATTMNLTGQVVRILQGKYKGHVGWVRGLCNKKWRTMVFPDSNQPTTDSEWPKQIEYFNPTPSGCYNLAPLRFVEDNELVEANVQANRAKRRRWSTRAVENRRQRDQEEDWDLDANLLELLCGDLDSLLPAEGEDSDSVTLDGVDFDLSDIDRVLDSGADTPTVGRGSATEENRRPSGA